MLGSLAVSISVSLEKTCGLSQIHPSPGLSDFCDMYSAYSNGWFPNINYQVLSGICKLSRARTWKEMSVFWGILRRPVETMVDVPSLYHTPVPVWDLPKSTSELSNITCGPMKHLVAGMYVEIEQGGAPKIAKLVYNSNNYGLWYVNNYSIHGVYKTTNITVVPHLEATNS